LKIGFQLGLSDLMLTFIGIDFIVFSVVDK
jgi:hypothetical protein